MNIDSVPYVLTCKASSVNSQETSLNFLLEVWCMRRIYACARSLKACYGSCETMHICSQSYASVHVLARTRARTHTRVASITRTHAPHTTHIRTHEGISSRRLRLREGEEGMG